MSNKVKPGAIYRYQPVPLDILDRPHNITPGDIVRVVNLRGCPPANAMGHCHVQHLDGKFAGLVCTNSLTPYKRREN